VTVGFQTPAELALQEKLFPQPEGQGFLQGIESLRRKLKACLEQAIELKHWFIVEDNEINVFKSGTRLCQAVSHGVPGKARIVLLPGKALFLRRGDNIAVPNQGCGTVVVER
jgi:hypothetical protein